MRAWRFWFRGRLGGREAGHPCRKCLFHLLGIGSGQLVLLAERAVRPQGGILVRCKREQAGLRGEASEAAVLIRKVVEVDFAP